MTKLTTVQRIAIERLRRKGRAMNLDSRTANALVRRGIATYAPPLRKVKNIEHPGIRVQLKNNV